MKRYQQKEQERTTTSRDKYLAGNGEKRRRRTRRRKQRKGTMRTPSPTNTQSRTGQAQRRADWITGKTTTPTCRQSLKTRRPVPTTTRRKR